MTNRLRTIVSQALFHAIPARACRARTDLSGRHASTLLFRYPWFRAAALERRGRAA